MRLRTRRCVVACGTRSRSDEQRRRRRPIDAREGLPVRMFGRVRTPTRCLCFVALSNVLERHFFAVQLSCWFGRRVFCRVSWRLCNAVQVNCAENCCAIVRVDVALLRSRSGRGRCIGAVAPIEPWEGADGRLLLRGTLNGVSRRLCGRICAA